jgi:hypothetical protein
MSAIIELKDPSDKTYAKVRNVVYKAGFRVVGDSAYYLAIAKAGYMNTDGIINLLENKSKGLLIAPNRLLSRSRKALGRIAMAFYHGEEVETEEGKELGSEPSPAELGLATMHPALKYQKQERKKK